MQQLVEVQQQLQEAQAALQVDLVAKVVLLCYILKPSANSKKLRLP